MTVAQLISKLQTFPRELPVVIDGYEMGVGRFTEENVRLVTLKAYAHIRKENYPRKPYKQGVDDWHYGEAILAEDNVSVKAVYISRVNDSEWKERTFEARDYIAAHDILE